MKKTMYLVAWTAIRTETEWAKIYERLVPLKCRYDEKLQVYKMNRVVQQPAQQAFQKLICEKLHTY